MMRGAAVLLCALLAGLAAPPAAGAGPDANADTRADTSAEDSALQLADQTAEQPLAARDWRAHAELARSFGATQESRLALDVRLDRPLAAPWRLVWASRLDLRSRPPAGLDHAIHTLQELSLGRALAPGLQLAVGRIDLRSGAALGWNPSDFFRAGALRSYVASDPASLRENRQGSVMLHLHKLWDGGSFALALSPRLRSRAQQPGGWDLDWGATNPRHRLWLSLSPRVGQAWSPQALALFEQGRPPSLGLNLSGLLGDATVAYLDWAGSSRALPLDADGREAWRSQWVAGLRHSLQNRLVLSAELQHNGRGLDADAWRALRSGPPARYAAYRWQALDAQNPPTQRGLLLRADWEDALAGRLDLAAMWQLDATDHSQRLWLQARHRLRGQAPADGLELIVQIQHSRGAPLTQYVEAPLRWELALRRYF